MARSEGGENGNGEKSGGGGSATEEGGNSSSADTLQAILARLTEMNKGIEDIGVRVSALETATKAHGGDDQAGARAGLLQSATRASHFVRIEDPDSGTKKMLDVSLKAALEKYELLGKDDTAAAFREDFNAWEEKHFRTADKRLVREVRDLLLIKRLPIRREAFLPISKTLVEFRDGPQRSDAQSGARRATASMVEHGGAVPGRPPEGGGSEPSDDSDHNGDRERDRDRNRDHRTRGFGTADTRGMSYRNLSAKPADVSKALPRDAVYEGKPTENIRRKYQLFLSACRLSGLDLDDEDLIIDVMSLSWLRGAARLYFDDRLRHVKIADEVVNLLERHFLHVRVRRINEERWNSLTYDLVRSRQQSQSPIGAHGSHESILNHLFSEIDTLADLRVAVERSDESILSKIISAVRTEDIFRPVCLQPPNSVEEMKSLLRGVAVEADNRALLEKNSISASPSSFVAMAALPDSDSEEHTPDVYFIDRRYLSGNSTRKVPGYGARYSIQRTDKRTGRTPKSRGSPRKSNTRGATTPKGVEMKLRDGTVLKPDQCIVCREFGCHSSRHNKATKAFLTACDTETASDHDSEEGDAVTTPIDESAGASYASFLSASRACAFIGVNATESKGLIGMLVDTGASLLSTVGEKWLPTLRTATGSGLGIRTNAEDILSIQGIGKSFTRTKGSFTCPLYFGHQHYEIQVYVVPGFSPLLLSHRDMDRIGLSYHSLEKKLVRPEDGYEQDVVWHRDAPYLPFASVSLLSETQLKNIHRSLGHAPTDKVLRLLEVADDSLQSADVRAVLKKIADDCRTCSLTQPAPRRFLFSSRYEGIGSFNSTIFVDIMSLADGNVLHVICAGTGYQGAAFISGATAVATWKALCFCWLYIYCGAPDELYHDAGTNFASDEFRDACTALGITVHEVPTEAHHSIGAVERAHATLRSVYNRVALDEPSLPREEKLLLDLRCVNDAPGPGGISPTMLVFGVIPKLHLRRSRDTSLAARVRTIRESTMLARRLKAQRVRDEAARRRHVPNLAHIRALEKLVPGDSVLVHREKEGWQSYPFVRLDRDAVVVQLPKKQSRFAVTSCRPAHMAQVTSAGDLVPIPIAPPPPPAREEQPLPSTPTPPVPRADEGDGNDSGDALLEEFLLDLPVNALSSPMVIPNDVVRARQTEIQGLLEKETFKFVREEESHGHRLYGFRWVDKVKPNGGLKSRFCIQAFNDRAHGLLTFAPTIQRNSLRLLLSIGSAYPVETRDVSQAFVQSESTLRRPVYVRAPPELELPPGYVLSVHRPLYGMPEAPLHWFTTYIEHHKRRLGMQQLCSDPCVLYTQGGLPIEPMGDDDDDDARRGIVGIQVDDSIIIGNEQSLLLEEEEAKRFLTKEKMRFGKTPALFNGLLVWRDDNNDLLVRCAKQDDLEKLEGNVLSFAEFRSVRARCAYVAHSASPLILYDVAQMSQVTEGTFRSDHTGDVQRVLTALPQAPPLRYHAPLRGDLEVAVCIDASFASNEDMSSQLGVICMLREKDTGKCNVVHYISVKSKRVCRSVLVAELLAMIEGYDVGFAVRNAARELTGSDLPLAMYTDSQSVYHLSVSLTRTRERRMQIDLQILREAYEQRDITDICWISGATNPADGLTKRSSNKALYDLVHSSVFAPEKQSIICRDDAPVRAMMYQPIHKAKWSECGAPGN